jgi:hypothetical protein
MRGTSGVSLALAGLGAVHALPTRTTVEERSPQIVLPPYTTITPGDPPPKNCQPEWVKFGICIPLTIPGEIIPNVPTKVKREDGEDKFVIGKPIVGPITPDKPNKPSKPWKWWLPPKDGENKWWFGKPIVGPITPDKPIDGGEIIPDKPVEGGEITPDKPVEGGEIKPSDKRDVDEHDPIFIIGPPKVGPIIPDKPIKGGKIRPSDKRDKDPIFVIGPPKVGPIIPDKPIKGGKIKPSDKRDVVKERPVTDRPVTDRPVTDRPVGGRPVIERPVGERPIKRSGDDHDPIFVIGKPIVGPFIPDKPIKGGKIRPSDKRQTLIIGPPSSGEITPVQPSPPGSGIVLPPGSKRSGDDKDPIFVIGKPIVGPFEPEDPIKGGKIKPSD